MMNRNLVKKTIQSFLSSPKSNPAKQFLLKEAENLRKCIQTEINNYYYSYNPSFYKRTYGLKTALNDGKPIHFNSSNMIKIDVNAMTLSIELKFNENRSYGKSMFKGEKGYKPLLINSGWSVKKNVWFKSTYRLGFYEGYDFIKKGIDKYKKDAPSNINVVAIGKYDGYPDVDLTI